MNVLINFRYLNGFEVNSDIVDQIIDSNELESIIDGFKSYTENIIQETNENIEAYFLKKNGAINSSKVKNTKNAIEKICNTNIDKYNKRLEFDSYLFLDEICSVFIKNGKAIPMEDPEDYVNYSDVKRCVQDALYKIVEHHGIDDFDLSSYSNVIYLVYIDIIQKNLPLVVF